MTGRLRGPAPIAVVSSEKSSDPRTGALCATVSPASDPVEAAPAPGLWTSKIVAHFVQRIFFTAAPAKRDSS